MTSHYSLNLMTREDCFLLHVEIGVKYRSGHVPPDNDDLTTSDYDI